MKKTYIGLFFVNLILVIYLLATGVGSGLDFMETLIEFYIPIFIALVLTLAGWSHHPDNSSTFKIITILIALWGPLVYVLMCFLLNNFYVKFI